LYRVTARLFASGAFHILLSAVKNYSLTLGNMMVLGIIIGIGQYVVCTTGQYISPLPSTAVDICIILQMDKRIVQTSTASMPLHTM